MMDNIYKYISNISDLSFDDMNRFKSYIALKNVMLIQHLTILNTMMISMFYHETINYPQHPATS